LIANNFIVLYFVDLQGHEGQVKSKNVPGRLDPQTIGPGRVTWDKVPGKKKSINESDANIHLYLLERRKKLFNNNM